MIRLLYWFLIVPAWYDLTDYLRARWRRIWRR